MAVVLTGENKEALLLGVICEPVVLLALTVVLFTTDGVVDIRDGLLRAVTFAVVFATDNGEDTIREGRPRVVMFAVLFAAVEDFCTLVPLFMLEIAPGSLAVLDELSGRPFSIFLEAIWVLWAEPRTLRTAGAVFGIIIGGTEL